ncbi:hypothetical protein T08_6516 [Trichinella sp. T8]|nr:hypothetical protein T08_6516 [Trichinella sp. T8]
MYKRQCCSLNFSTRKGKMLFKSVKKFLRCAEDTVGEVSSSFYFFVAEIASWFLPNFITMNPLHQFYGSYARIVLLKKSQPLVKD